MQYECMMSRIMSALYVLTKRKPFANYRWCTHSRWQSPLISVVSSSGMTYAIIVIVPAKDHNRYMTYITIYPPSCAHVFNAARIALYTLREHIYVLRKRPQYIPRSPRPRCTVVASRTTDTQPLPHDRDCPQANLILRGWIRDSHHPAGGYLPSYLIVGASLQESKL
jgi:hypothetical protein